MEAKISVVTSAKSRLIELIDSSRHLIKHNGTKSATKTSVLCPTNFFPGTLHVFSTFVPDLWKGPPIRFVGDGPQSHLQGTTWGHLKRAPTQGSVAELQAKERLTLPETRYCHKCFLMPRNFS